MICTQRAGSQQNGFGLWTRLDVNEGRWPSVSGTYANVVQLHFGIWWCEEVICVVSLCDEGEIRGGLGKGNPSCWGGKWYFEDLENKGVGDGLAATRRIAGACSVTCPTMRCQNPARLRALQRCGGRWYIDGGGAPADLGACLWREWRGCLALNFSGWGPCAVEGRAGGQSGAV